MDAVCMSGGGDKIDTEAGKIEKRSVQNVCVRFTGIASGSRNLPEL